MGLFPWSINSILVLTNVIGLIHGQFWPPQGGFWNPGAQDFFQRLNTGRFNDQNGLRRPSFGGFGSGTLAGANIDCSIGPDPGPCTNNQTKWYFNERFSQCLTFLYGGCLGNPNNYASKEECSLKCKPRQATATNAPEQNPCTLPSDAGPCRGRLNRFFYNKVTKQCELFNYGGCKGNRNNFQDITTCRQVCAPGSLQNNGNREQGNPGGQPQNGPQPGRPQDGGQGAPPNQGGPNQLPPNKGFPNQGFPNQGSPNQGPPNQGSPNQGFPNQGPPNQGPPNQGQPNQGFPNQGPPNQGPPNQGPPNQGQPNEGFPNQGPPNQGQPNQGFPNQGPPNQGPPNQGFPNQGPPNQGRPNQGFPNQGSPNQGLPQQPSSGGQGIDICLLAPEGSNCQDQRQREVRFFFNPNSGVCTEFTYYPGCQGNPNNFRTENECIEQCARGRGPNRPNVNPNLNPTNPNQNPNNSPNPNAGQQPPPPAFCFIPPIRGECSNFVQVFYFDANVNDCREFRYGGCGGNQNKFEKYEDCMGICFRGRSGQTDNKEVDICVKQPQTGPCNNRNKRFYYDPNVRHCREFIYGGCEGNGNNFQSVQSCESRCGQDNNQAPIATTSMVTEPLPISTLTPSHPCTQEVDSGPCDGKVSRYYFDPSTKQCLRFTYGGCQGNDNNFENFEACRSWCLPVVTTTLPPPIKQDSPVTNQRPASPSPIPNPCIQSLNQGPCEGNVTRYFFDSYAKQCRQFRYGGCLGNDNNFQTLDACRTWCRPGRGLPPRQSTPVPTSKSTNNTEVCLQPPLIGQCRARIPRYFFDVKTGNCREFMYGGCEGNQNNFKDKEKCENRCKPTSLGPGPSVPNLGATSPTKTQNVCSLPLDPGPCNARIARFYYDYTARSCKGFVFGGCKGNANNFQDLSACEDRCKGGLRLPPTSGTDTKCTLPAVTGACRARFVRFFHDTATGVCREFVYGGCGANANNFKSKEECEAECKRRPDVRTRTDCKSPPENGRCLAFFRRFYFDVQTQKCMGFVYGGCGGNENNYKTKAECEVACPVQRAAVDPQLMNCPAPAGVGACSEMCRNDSNCGKGQKCCYNGCGRLCIRV